MLIPTLPSLIVRHVTPHISSGGAIVYDFLTTSSRPRLQNENFSNPFDGSVPEYCRKIVFESANSSGSDLPILPEECIPQKYRPIEKVVITLILTLLTLGTAVGNFLIILSVGLVRKLQTPCNLLIVNLACSDFLVSVLVLPLAIMYEILGYWSLDMAACDAFILLDVLLCTSSILNLCAISIDRYLVITRPLMYAVNRTPCRMALMIFISWFLSALISIPPVIGWKRPYKPYVCFYSEDLGYQIYATLIAFYVPLLVMLFLYGRIFQLARQIAKAEKRQTVTSFGGGTNYFDSSNGGLNKASLSTPDEVDTFQSAADAISESRRLIRFTHSPALPRSTPETPQVIRNGGAHKTSLEKASSVTNLLSNRRVRRKKRLSRNNESKAIKTLGIIMGSFTLCWLPFFVSQLIIPIRKVIGIHPHEILPHWLSSLFLWLGYLNSFLNPLIYAKFNREFRTPFIEILSCRCRRINNRLRTESFAEQFGLPLRRRRSSANDLIVSFNRRSRTAITVENGHVH